MQNLAKHTNLLLTVVITLLCLSWIVHILIYYTYIKYSSYSLIGLPTKSQAIEIMIINANNSYHIISNSENTKGRFTESNKTDIDTERPRRGVSYPLLSHGCRFLLVTPILSDKWPLENSTPLLIFLHNSRSPNLDDHFSQTEKLSCQIVTDYNYFYM